MTYQAGRHFLQVPGPSNIPDRILRAIAQPVLDHRGPAWARLQAEVFERVRPVFKTRQPVMIFPASGTGGWESALVNTLSPGDQVLTFDTGQFAVLWGNMAHKLGLDVKMLATDWRRAPSPEAVEAVLTDDRAHKIKAVLLVHNETSNGVMSRVAEIRKAMDRAGHPALLMLDTISSLGSADMRMDEWGIDVVIAGSQKGLMLPTGLAFVAVSDKARAAMKSAAAAARLLGLGADAGRRRGQGQPAVHAGLQPVLRPQGSARHDRGGGAGERLRPPRAPCRSDAPRGARLGPRHRLRGARANTASR